LNNKLLITLIFLSGFVLNGCAVPFIGEGGSSDGRMERDNPPSESQVDSPNDERLIQTGRASWYGGKFQGRKTASGEIFNKWELTAAHRTLPLGTRVLVRRVDSGQTVNVRINDRGPFVRGRIIDLSRGAARELDMVRKGIARVRLYAAGESNESSGDKSTVAGTFESSSRNSDGANALFSIQVGAFQNRSNAISLRARMTNRFDEVRTTRSYDGHYRIRVGRFGTKQRAERRAKKLRNEGFETWIVRRDDS